MAVAVTKHASCEGKGSRPIVGATRVLAFLLILANEAMGGVTERAECLGPTTSSAIRACQSELRSGILSESPRDRRVDYEVSTALGKHLNSVGRFDEAVEVFEEALRFHSGDRRLQQLLAIAKSNLEEQQWANKRRQSTTGKEASGQTAALKLNRLYCKSRTGREALDACEKVLAEVPDDSDAKRRQAQLLAALGPSQRDSRSPAEPPVSVQGEEKDAQASVPASGQGKRQLIADIQEKLNLLGLDAGPVDGLAGQRTRAAAQQFAGLSGISPALDEQLASALERALDQDRSATLLVSEAEEIARRGELDNAFEVVQSARVRAPWNVAAQTFEVELKSRIGVRDEENRRRFADVQQMVVTIDQALTTGDLETAGAIAAEGLEKYPDEGSFARLGQRVADERKQLEAEERERIAKKVALLERALAARSEGALDQALDLLTEGLMLAPDDTQLLALRNEIETQQVADERERNAALELAARLEELDRLALAARRVGDLDTSLIYIDEALALAPENLVLGDLRQAVEAERRRERRELAAAAARADRAEKLLVEAQRLQGEQKFGKVLALVDEGLTLVPDHEGLEALRSSIKEEALRIDQERAEAAERERQMDELLADAREARIQGDLDAALQRVARALELMPAQAEAVALKSQLETDRSKMIADRREAERLLVRAEELRQAGEFESSLRNISQGLERIPDHSELLALRGEVEADLARARQAEISAQEARGLLNRGRDALRAGELKSAHAYAERGLAISPDDGELLNLMTSVEAEQLRVREAREREQELASWANEILDRSREMRRGGDFEGSLALIDDALERVPNHPVLQELRRAVGDDIARLDQDRTSFERYLVQAEDAVDSGDLDFAERLLERAQALFSDDPRLQALRQGLEHQRTAQIRAQVARYAARAQRRYRDASSALGTSKASDERLVALEDAYGEIEKGLKLAPRDSTLLALGERIESERRSVEDEIAAALQRAEQLEIARREINNLQQALAMVKAEREADELASRVLAQKILKSRLQATR